VMIGRAAMSSPWIFAQVKAYLEKGILLPEPTLSQRWEGILDHCRQEVAWRTRAPGDELRIIHSMRAKLMAYTRCLPGGRLLRGKLQHVSSVEEVQQIADSHLEAAAAQESLPRVKSERA
jgi:tRNA-dihydrouridine synthase B